MFAIEPIHRGLGRVDDLTERYRCLVVGGRARFEGGFLSWDYDEERALSACEHSTGIVEEDGQGSWAVRVAYRYFVGADACDPEQDDGRKDEHQGDAPSPLAWASRAERTYANLGEAIEAVERWFDGYRDDLAAPSETPQTTR